MTTRTRLGRYSGRLGAASLIAALALFAGCATNPVTGRRQLSLVSEQRELEIGRDGHQAVLKEYGAYDDPKLQAYVDSVGQRLAKVSHLPNLQWHFTLLDDPVVNAFAMPGGYIYITRGILAHLNSEAQLAGVLGHEIGHVTARHSAQRITQQQIAGLGLGLASIVSQGFSQYSEAAQTALSLVFLKYSRSDETQADELGVEYSVKAGYDAREMPATYQMLKRVGERAGQRLPSFLSTHPDPGDRESRTRALAVQATAGKSGLVIGGRAYVQRLDGVVFGADPRQGSFDGARFFHPRLGFEIGFPRGWKTQNSRESVAAVEPEQHASMELALADAAGLSPSEYVGQLERAGRISGARGGAERIGGFAAWTGRLAVPAEGSGERVLVAAFIRKSDALMFQILGQSAQPGDADEMLILTSARSFRELTDPARLAASPDRVHVVTVSEPGTFEQVIGRLGRQRLALDDASILNNLDPGENVLAGQLLKIVEPGAR